MAREKVRIEVQKKFIREAGSGVFQIQAQIRGDGLDKKKGDFNKFWTNEEGRISQYGEFDTPKADEITEDKIFKVKVQWAKDSDVYEDIEVLITPKPKKLEKPKDKSIIIEPIGSQGTYFVKVQVIEARKASVIFTEVSASKESIFSNGKRTITKDTNEKGFLLLSLTPFKENSRVIDLQLIGSEQKERVFLEGLKKEICPRCKSLAWNGTRCRDCNYPKQTIYR